MLPRSAEAQPWFRRSVLHSQPTRSARAVAHTPTRVGAPAARAECVRLPRARGGVRPTQNPLLPPSNPSPRARAPPRARGSLPSVQVCPSSRTSRPILSPLKCVLASIRPLPDPTLASCPSRPRTPFLRYSLPTCQQPAHRVRATPRPHACTPLPSCLALRPRHLLVQEVSPHTPDAAAAHSGRAAAARNRAAGSTPAARTPPHTRVASPRPSTRGVLSSTPPLPKPWT